MTLAHIRQESNYLEALLEAIDPADEESLNLLYAALDDLRSQEAEKIDAWHWHLSKLEAHIKFLKEQEQAIAQSRKSAEKKLESAKEYLLMLHSQGQIPAKLQGKLAEIRVVKNSQMSVEVDPLEFDDWVGQYPQLAKFQYSPNKTAILETYKAGGELPPGIDITQGHHIRMGIRK